MSGSSKSRGRLLPALLVAAVVLPLVFALGSARAAPTELFFSEYIEGTSNNKALEIYNGTGAPVDLGANSYAVQMCFNGSAACALNIPLVGTVAPGDVFVLAQSAASPVILAQADQTNGAGWFNGDDVVVLRKGATLIDVIGQLGFDPGTEWGTGLTSTADNTLRRKGTIEAGDSNPSDVFDPAVEWDGFATDDFTGLGAHSTVVADAAPQVTATSPTAGATGVSPSRRPVGDLQRAGERHRRLVHDLLRAERRAHGDRERRARRRSRSTPTSTSRSAETCTATIAGRAGRRPGRRRPARHDGGELRLVVHDRRAGPAHPRDPGRRAPLSARGPGRLGRARHRHGQGLERLLLRGSEPGRRPGDLRGPVRLRDGGRRPRRRRRRRPGRRVRDRVPPGRRGQHQPDARPSSSRRSSRSSRAATPFPGRA